MAIQQAELPVLTEWRGKLEGLFADIRSWLSEMEPPPTIERSSTRIIERYSGEYEAPMLIVRQGEGEFRVRPIARSVVGAEGRVDLEGGGGPYILVRMVEKGPGVFHEQPVLMEDQEIDGWFWVQDRHPYKPVPLTGELFRDLAETCLE